MRVYYWLTRGAVESDAGERDASVVFNLSDVLNGATPAAMPDILSGQSAVFFRCTLQPCSIAQLAKQVGF